MSKSEFSEFCALLQAQRKQLLDEVRKNIAAWGENLGFANQSKITEDSQVIVEKARTEDTASAITPDSSSG